MNGDFSTLRFNKAKRFAKVMHQQGRVMTDADLNEAAAIAGYFDENERIDVIGQTGTPAHHAGFGIAKPDGTPATTATPWGNLCLTDGRYYIDGKVVEIFKNPNGTLVSLNSEVTAQPAAGRYWAVLDAWERYVSPAEDPDIVEEALRGPDTSGRTRVDWHVRLVPAGASAHCDQSVIPVRSSFGTLAAFAPDISATSDPCETPNVGGYQGLENQLYRVEVHNGSADAGGVTLKWSRENGCLLSQIGTIDKANKLIEVSSPGKDSKTGYQAAKFIEALTIQNLHDATRGGISEVVTATDEKEIEVSTWIGDFDTNAVVGNYLRGWHGYITGVAVGTAIDIDGKGLTITIGAGTLEPGDYWIIPARAITGNVLWPESAPNVPAQLRPFGTSRSSALLGLLDRTGSNWTLVSDCRNIFYPLTEQERFVYVSGDGQEAMPGQPIVGDLVVGVVNGPAPVRDAHIRWTFVGAEITSTRADDRTDNDGLARFTISAIKAEHAVVKAEYLDDAGIPIQTPILFNINQSKASMVSYDPLAGCNTLAGKTTVQMAIDRLAGIKRLYVLGGDAQVALRDPGDHSAYLPLLEPLRVRVTSLCGPAAGVKVDFSAIAPGEISADGVTWGATTLQITTGTNGIAECRWRPAFGVAGQHVTASFGSDGFSPSEQVTFSFQALDAKDISFSPKCDTLVAAKSTTVQEALEALCDNLNKGGAGCDITVGKAGQYPNIPEALKGIQSRKLRRVKICLMPDPRPYELNDLLEITDPPYLGLEIHGGGPLTELLVQKGGINVDGITAFVLKDLHIKFVDPDSSITIRHCQDVEVKSCTIERLRFQEAKPLFTSELNENVRLNDSSFDSSINSALKSIPSKKLKYEVLWTEDIMGEQFKDLTTRLMPFFAIKDSEADLESKLLDQSMRNSFAGNPTFEGPMTKWMQSVKSLFNTPESAFPDKAKQFLSQYRESYRVLRLVAGTGAVLDHLGETWVENCEFSSLVSFSGLPIIMNSDTFGSLDGKLKEFEVRLTGNGHMTHLKNNRFFSIVFGKAIEEWIKGNHTLGEGYAWADMFTLQGNYFQSGPIGLLGHTMHMTNNQFMFKNDMLGLAYADRLLPLGNSSESSAALRVLKPADVAPFASLNRVGFN